MRTSTAQPTIAQILGWRPDELIRVRTLIGLRRYWMRSLFPELRRRYEDTVGDDPPTTMDAVREVVDGLPGRNRFLALDRYIQLRLWEEIGRMVDVRLQEHPDLLDPRPDDLGGLRLDGGLQLPGYYADYDFHQQPGGIWRGDRGALIYAMGAQVIHVDSKQPFALHDAFADSLPIEKADRVIDLGCGYGKTTFSLARRFSDVHVIGIDLAAPVLRLGRRMATEREHAIDWMQGDAEQTGEAAESADAVVCSMLLHELPLSSIDGTLREAHRILRPGGVFVALEPWNAGDPLRDVLGAYHSEITGEPYINDFRAQDFAAMAERAGFASGEERKFTPPGAPPADSQVWTSPWGYLTAIKE